MPGAGKSTAGVVLAKILNYGFVDVDLLIQQKHGKTLQRLIECEGPDGFIQLENEVLQGIDAEHAVIATGGSAVYSEEGMRHLCSLGRCVFLQVSFEELQERLGNLDERGVVFPQRSTFDLRALYEERTPLYERYADCIVEVGNLSTREAAEKIAQVVSGD